MMERIFYTLRSCPKCNYWMDAIRLFNAVVPVHKQITISFVDEGTLDKITRDKFKGLVPKGNIHFPVIWFDGYFINTPVEGGIPHRLEVYHLLENLNKGIGG